MAKYRQLYTEFWSDSFVLELTPEEKYFYLYLMTNSKTTQCGIYEISKRIIETETGYSRETVDKLIKRFCDYNKILYCEDTKELMVVNWIKYNLPNNVNAIKCVHGELCRVKHKEFLKILFKKCVEAKLEVEKIFENLIVEEAFDSASAYCSVAVDCSLEKVDKFSIDFPVDSSSEEIFMKIEDAPKEDSKDSLEKEEIQELNGFMLNNPLSRGLQGPYKVLPSNRIRNNKEEVINKNEKAISKEEEEEEGAEVVIRHESNSSATDYEGLKNIIKIFEENVHAITPLEYEKILDFKKQISGEVIIMAIEEAVNYNAKTMKYISKILDSWISNGIKTAEGVKAYQEQWTNKKSSNISHNVKKGGFCDYEQRNYDFDVLEKRLLGLVDTGDF